MLYIEILQDGHIQILDAVVLNIVFPKCIPLMFSRNGLGTQFYNVIAIKILKF
jgi:hypothetical protein